MSTPIRFPTADELTVELRIDASAYENRWLCDGQVRTWAGESMADANRALVSATVRDRSSSFVSTDFLF